MSALTVTARGRRAAESMMVDTVRVTTAGTDAWDPVTGTFIPGPRTVHYEGPARIRNGNPAPQTADAGETVWAADLFTLSLPWHVASVDDGMDVEVVAVGPLSTVRVGRHFTVMGPHEQSYSTARRFQCQVVTHDA